MAQVHDGREQAFDLPFQVPRSCWSEPPWAGEELRSEEPEEPAEPVAGGDSAPTRWHPFLQRHRAHLSEAWSVLERDIVCTYAAFRNPELQMTTLHLRASSHLVLMGSAVLYSLYGLQTVLVPFIVGAGLAVLLEPLVYLMVDFWVRCVTPKRLRPSLQGILDSSGRVGVVLRYPMADREQEQAQHRHLNLAVTHCRRAVCVFATLIAVFVLLGIFGGLAFWVAVSLQAVDWNKYLNGPRMDLIRQQAAAFGIDDLNATILNALSSLVQSLGVSILGSTLNFLVAFCLMLLCLGFLLFDSADARSLGKEPWRPSQRKVMAQVIRRVLSGPQESELSVIDDLVPQEKTLLGRLRIAMRMYITVKFYLSVIKGLFVGGLFSAMKVDLWVIWAVLTVVMNFIPMGSAVSIFAPVPFILLDPEKSFLVVIVCVGGPLVMNNVLGNVVEPRVFASSLSLDPITVLLALTFWSALWGLVGAVVCVPATAAVRVLLQEALHHPYAVKVLRVMEGGEPHVEPTTPKAQEEHIELEDDGLGPSPAGLVARRRITPPDEPS